MKTKDYIIFGKKIGLILLLLVAVDWIAGYTLSYLYYQQKSGTKYRTTYALDGTKADIIVLGSSRASHHYDTRILEDSLNLSAYNAGRDGTNLIYSHAVLNSILKRHQPKLVILDFNSSEFYNVPTREENLVSLLPYYNNHPELKPFIRQRSELEMIKLCSKVYPFNSTIVSSITGLRKSAEADFKGYLPINGTMDSPELDTLDFNKYVYSEKLIKNFEDIIVLCKNANIQLFVVQSPRLDWYLNDRCENTLKDIAVKNNMGFVSFVNDSVYSKKTDLYKDQSHLNESGASQFTAALIPQIKMLLKK
jgi:hypothetical protein